MTNNWKSYCIAILSAALLLAFQNCGPSFQAINSPSESQSASSQTPVISPDPQGTPTPGPLPTPVPTPVPTPLPTPLPTPQPKALLETRVYLGGSGPYIQSLRINHANDQVTKLPLLSLPLHLVGWMNFDLASGFLLASDAGLPALTVRLSYPPANGILQLAGMTANTATSVHSSLVKGANNFFLYSADYTGGVLSTSTLSLGLDNLIVNPTVQSFGNTAKTHSSAFDPTRNLLFVSNLGLNLVSIFKVNLSSGALTPVGSLTVTTPRTLVYDATYDKLYLATEASAVSSFIYGYSISEQGGLVALSQVAALAIPLIGADLKVDHNNRFVIATARELGKQSVWGMPVTTLGVQDANRLSFTFNVNRVQPRSLEISADGKYAVVAMDSAQVENIQVYKMSYDQNLNFISANMIYSDLVGVGFTSSLSIPYYQP